MILLCLCKCGVDNCLTNDIGGRSWTNIAFGKAVVLYVEWIKWTINKTHELIGESQLPLEMRYVWFR